MVYITKTLLDRKEKDNLQILFEILDENRDGDVTLREFVTNFRDKFDVVVTEQEMAKIIRRIDVNGDRDISFTEFLIAACNKNNLLTEANL